MHTYKATFWGKIKGVFALANSYCDATVEGENEEQARLKLNKSFEDIRRLKLQKAS